MRVFAEKEHVVRDMFILWNTIKNDLVLPQRIVNTIGDWSIGSHIAGLKTSISMLSLCSLLEDRQLWQDVIDALLETTYMQCQVVPNLAKPLILPIDFASFALAAVDHPPILNQLRPAAHRFEDLETDSLIGVVGIDGHYTAYRCDSAGYAEYYDSMGGNPPPKLLRSLADFVDSCEGRFAPESIVPVRGEVQWAGTNGCGLAAYNYIANCCDITAVQWTNETAHLHRLGCLAKLLVWNYYAILNKAVSTCILTV